MNLPKYIQGVLFDLDGTLLDSLHVWKDVDRRFFARRGLVPRPDYFDAIKTLDLSAAALYTKREYALPDPPEAMVAEWLDMIREEYEERVALKPFAGEYVKKLYTDGMKLGVVTSAARELFLPALTRHGLAQYFTAFTEAREAKRGKDFPDPYLLAAEKLGVSPDRCAVFEDILPGVKSARAGGFFTAAVADPFSAREEALLREESDLFVHSFEELL